MAATYLVPFALLFCQALGANPCWQEERGTKLLHANPLSTLRTNNLDECGQKCLTKDGCVRLMQNRITGTCNLYGQPAQNERRTLSAWHTYAAVNSGCLNQQAGEKNRRAAVLTNSYIPQTQWAEWEAWNPCTATCGAGSKQRSRQCKSYQGGQCDGAAEEVSTCQKGPCSNWNEWTQWTPCSVTCGKGTITRTRFCNTYYGCPGDRDEKNKCNPGSCNQWQPWGSWGACSKLCGGGQSTRTRECSGGNGCKGKGTENRDCNDNPCCAQWSQWSECSVTCGVAGKDGVETKRRRCTVETKGSGYSVGGYSVGGYASKEETEDRPCSHLPPCAQWNDWQPWGDCSVTCGGGERLRNRGCSPGNAQCDGTPSEATSCHDEQCPGWREWTAWTLCSASCGGGTKARSRVCSVTGQCEGDSVAEKECNKFPCPEWTDWSSWSFCSHSCGGGWQSRNRVCNQYNLCAGDNKEKQMCNEYECPQMNEWEEWGPCSEPCGGGVQVRNRGCGYDASFCQADQLASPSCQCDGTVEDGQACNSHKCASWSEWESWGSCNSECDGGTRVRTRTCENDKSFCVGANKDDTACLCEGGDTEDGACSLHKCPEWSSWGEWGQCSVTCGGGAKERKRTCINDPNFCTEENKDSASCKCEGLDHSNDQCNTQLCPQWTQWGPWGECDQLCEGGIKLRYRECQVDEEFCASNPSDAACQCEGESEEPESCNEQTCANWGEWAPWSTCSASCEGGIHTRTRECNADPSYCFGDALNEPGCQCEGPEQEEDFCNEHECAGWSEWSEWEQCSVSCGGGKQFRTRECFNDEEFCTGANANDPTCQCTGRDEDESDCNTFDCPYWSTWAQWSDCSVTCSKGTKDRKRNCINDPSHCSSGNLFEPECTCDGNDVDATECDAGECYHWSQWNAWNECSRVCGGGSRNRARECPVVNACPGLNEETEFCNQVPCPDWGSWSQWSSCSVTCNGGQRVRNRACPLEGGCTPGEPFESKDCGNDPCPQWADWSDWSHCDRSCGEGNRKRERVCEPIDGCLGRATDVEPCFEAACPITTYWSAWSPCTETCGGGTQTRSRSTCATPGCPTEKETQECEKGQCPGWGQWQAWSQCSGSCGGGSRVRARLCEDTSGIEIPRGCIGKAEEIDPAPCNDIPCILLGRLFL